MFISINIPIKLDWFSEPIQWEAPYLETAITSKLIKQILRNKETDTDPGENGLLYGVLVKLPSVHHFLATLYNNIDAEGIAPSMWASCNITLCLKAGSPKDPSTFRPMALSFNLGKILCICWKTNILTLQYRKPPSGRLMDVSNISR